MRLCSDIMITDMLAVGSKTTISDAAKKMKDHKIGMALVVDNDQLVGIVTERDFLYKVVAEGVIPEASLVSDIITTIN